MYETLVHVKEVARRCQPVGGRQRQRQETAILAHVKLSVLREGQRSGGV